jgi:aminoglycoside phosphotransferase (APT) family kinase protein
MTPVTIPHGRTARRLEWQHLPPAVRAVIEKRLGSPVVEAATQRGGFAPGLASVLTCADGSQHFVKAASLKAQKAFALSYREEARRLRTLPPASPAPRLAWVHDADDWVVLGIEYAAGRPPARPWTADDLAACSAALVAAADTLTPAPGLGVAAFAEEWADLLGHWDEIAELQPDLPLDQVAEAAALAHRIEEAAAGETLVHGDVRDDNLLLGADQVWLCDWTWPTRGAAWIDSLALLIGPRGDGLDVETHIAAHPLLADVPAEHIDIVLAFLAGHFLWSCAQPVPSSSPYLRKAQAWQATVVWEWLAERRGWDA